MDYQRYVGSGDRLRAFLAGLFSTNIGYRHFSGGLRMEQIRELRRMAMEARRLAELLPDLLAVERLHTHAEKLEASALELESQLCDAWVLGT